MKMKTLILILIALALYAGALYVAATPITELAEAKTSMQLRVGQAAYTILETIN